MKPRESGLYSDAKSLKHCPIGDAYINESNKHSDWLTRRAGMDLVDGQSDLTQLHEKAYVDHMTNLL